MRKEKKIFQNKEIPNEAINFHADYNLEDLYDHASSELTLQQSKRDQIISVYLALVTFIVPFALSSSNLSISNKGLIFTATGFVGILFSLIIIRYRLYKEVYWLTCQTITVLSNCIKERIDKSVVQAAFYQCIYKKGKSYIKIKNNKKKFMHFKYVKKNLFSSETIYFLIHSIISIVILSLGVGLTIDYNYINIIIPIILGLIVLILLLYSYFSKLIDVFKVLADDSDESFNKAFSKAWFLHFYLEK